MVESVPLKWYKKTGIFSFFMEFLDPIARKKRKRQLFFGYGLLSILVGLATYVLVATAVGYEIFNVSGEAVQNGLVFVASEPVPADISVNGRSEGDRTEKRMALPAGEYTITLNEPGYTSWSKKIAVEGGKVRFLPYPRLYPTDLKTEKVQDLPASTGFTTQSIDQRWVVVQQNSALPAIEIFDITKNPVTSVSVVFPSTILGNVEGNYGTFEPLEWSNDNRHFLLVQRLPDGKQNFLLIDRENIDASVNLSTLFGVEPISVSLFDKKADRFYMYFGTGGLLRVADLNARTIGEPILDQVLTYTSNGSDLVLYSTTRDATSGKVAVKALTGGRSYDIGELAFDSTNRYFLSLSQFDGNWYYAIGSGQSDRVLVYKNPLNFARDEKKPALLVALRAGVPTSLNASPKYRFIISVSGQSLAVYDTEEDRVYRFDLSFPIDSGAKVTWVDEFHLQTVSNGEVHVFEFDGQNDRNLQQTKGTISGFFDREVEKLLTIASSGEGQVALYRTGLLAGN